MAGAADLCGVSSIARREASHGAHNTTSPIQYGVEFQKFKRCFGFKVAV